MSNRVWEALNSQPPSGIVTIYTNNKRVSFVVNSLEKERNLFHFI